jgi:RNA polymerase sigma-70 factor (ECF subfamily)
MSDADCAEIDDNDASLFLRFRDRGDVDAFEQLFRRHRDSLMAYLWTLTGNQFIAEDISQYCWLRLMESDRGSGYRPRPDATIVTYLRTLGRNRYIDEYKRKHAESRTDSVDDVDTRVSGSDTALDGAAKIEIRSSIEAALVALPIEQRDIISMWLQGFSIGEMMSVTTAPRDTVLSRKKYAIKKLKVAFEIAGVCIHDAAI